MAAAARRLTPDFSDADEEAVYTFTTELHENHRVSDAAFSAVLDTFGEEATLELTALAGYYTIISMVLNTFEVAAPEGAKPLP